MIISIIEDCAKDARLIYSYIKFFCDTNRLAAEINMFESGKKFLNTQIANKSNLAIIDIYLPDGNGVSIGESLLAISPKCKIAFCTTSTEYYRQGFDLGAIHYLLKPIDKERIDVLMNRLIENTDSPERFIELKSGRQLVKILLSQILYVDYYAHSVQVHIENRIIRSFIRFADIQSLLLKEPQFLLCYRNIIVNMDKIAAFSGRTITISESTMLPVNKERSSEIHSIYAGYVFSKLRRRGV